MSPSRFADTSRVFEQQRPLLTGVAYRMLGQVADAEDVVQETWLRWTATDRQAVAQPRAYLLQVVTRLATDRLRRLAARREDYVGPWLPEPILVEPDVGERAEMVDSISIAMLVVLETLSPLERAVFILHEAFGFSYPEVARIIDRNEPAVRQLAHRAREHIRARRPRYRSDRGAHAEVAARFVTACEDGDLDALLVLLAPDAVFVGDGGGIGRAPREPLHGAELVARFLIGLSKSTIPAITVEIASVNAMPGIIVRSAGAPLTVFVCDVADGRIQTIHAIANPDKLRRL